MTLIPKENQVILNINNKKETLLILLTLVLREYRPKAFIGIILQFIIDTPGNDYEILKQELIQQLKTLNWKSNNISELQKLADLLTPNPPYERFIIDDECKGGCSRGGEGPACNKRNCKG